MQNRILDYIQNKISILGYIQNEIENTSDISKKLQLIYDNAYRLDSSILDFYLSDCIQDPACTTSDLAKGFKNFTSAYKMDQYAILCLKQENFPQNRETYLQHAGEYFFNTMSRYISHLNIVNSIVMHNRLPDLECIYNMEELFALVFNYYQNMLNGDELHQLSNLLIRTYNSFRVVQPTTVWEKSITFFQNAFLLIMNHAEYQYLPSTACSDLFTFSAKEGCEEIFLKFYSHEGILASEKSNAIQLLKEHHHENIIINIADDLYQSFYKEVVVTFLLSNDLLNNDIRKYIINIFAQAARQEYSECLINTNEPPKIYQDNRFLPTLFQKYPIDSEWLLTRAVIKLRDYLINSGKNKIDKGVNRAFSFIYIFQNINLSTGFKMMALYALMHEKSNLLGKLTIQKFVEVAVQPYSDFIKNAAMDYANKYKQDLDSLADNLINYIHTQEKCYLFLIDTSEDVLILNIKENQNCLIM